MKAGILYEKGDIRYTDIDMPAVGDDDVLVKVKATGICGSDIPRVLNGTAHYFPIVLGHEFSGEVVQTGKDVSTIKPGDRVAGVPLLPCLKCDDCQRGSYSQCQNYSFVGSREQGSFAEYVKVPQRNVVKFDNNVSFEQGAFFEPATVALHGLNCADYKAGEDVAILGGGTIGLFTAQWAKIFGAKRVFVFDIVEERLELARKLGADVTVNTSNPSFKEDINKYTNGKGFGYVYETAGVDITMKLAFEIAGNKANVCFIGTPTRDLVFTPKLFENMNRKEFKLTGSWMSYSAPFPGKEWLLTAHYFSTGQLKYDESLVFKKIPLTNIKEAFEMYRSPRDVKGKILITE